MTIDPAIGASLGSADLNDPIPDVPHDLNYLVLSDLSRFDRSAIASIKPSLMIEEGEGRGLLCHGELINLPHLESVFAIVDGTDDDRSSLLDIASEFGVGIIA
jgi:hypothetical protein